MTSPYPDSDPSAARVSDLSDPIQANLDKISGFTRREEDKVSTLQRIIERICLAFGTPRFFLLFLVACAVWLITDYADRALSGTYFDAPPFSILQGIVSFMGVLITIAVLIRQNRLARVDGQRTHLELQVNLLAEQKATKIIQLIEELRRDLPNVPNRADSHAETLQEIINPDAVLQAIEDRSDGAPLTAESDAARSDTAGEGAGEASGETAAATETAAAVRSEKP